MKLLMQKHLGSLRPVDETGQDALQKIRAGDVVRVEVKKPRNGKHHRLYWQLVSTVWKNQSRYETAEQLHDALKLSAGIYDQLVMPSGEVYKIPGSIAFDTMDQLEFSAFYERICDVIAAHFLPGVTSAELKAEIESMIGISSPAQAAE